MAKKTSDKTEWDERIKGLGLRRAGRETWIVQRRVDGRTVRQTLGKRTRMSRGEARTIARGMISGEVEAPPKMTMKIFSERYLEDMRPGWAASTYASRKKLVKNCVQPFFGQREVASIRRADVVTWLDGLTLSDGSKNLALAHLSGMMRHAELLGHREAESNPCAGMRRRSVAFQARYLTAEECTRLGAALRAEEQTAIIALIRFLALTGARIGEARRMRWGWVEGHRVCLPDSKTGPRTIWLGTAAKQLLNQQPKCADLVFLWKGRAIGDTPLRKMWQAALRAADLAPMRLHDLRHSYAAVALQSGESLRTIAGLLGHSDLDTTTGYAELDERALRAAADKAARRRAKTLKPLVMQPPQSAPIQPAPIQPSRLAKHFLKGGGSLPAFCAAHGLDETRFRAEVTAAREARKGRL